MASTQVSGDSLTALVTPSVDTTPDVIDAVAGQVLQGPDQEWTVEDRKCGFRAQEGQGTHPGPQPRGEDHGFHADFAGKRCSSSSSRTANPAS